MTTMITQPDPAASTERALRLLPITANLLPVEVVESRRGRRVRRIVLSALAAFVAVLGGWYGLARYETSTARTELAAAEDAAQGLLRQQRAFAEVVGVQAQSEVVEAQLAALFADDLQWSRLLASVQRAAPGGIQVTGITGALDADDEAAAASSGTAATVLPNTSGSELIGTVTVTGRGSTKAAVAAYVDALGRVRGLGNPLLNDATVQDGALQFTIRLDLTEAALGGRYTADSGDGTGER